MTLQTAGTARAALDAKKPAYDYTCECMTALNTEIDRVIASTDDTNFFENKTAKVSFTTIDGVNIERTDESLLPIEIFIAAIQAKNYTVGHMIKVQKLIVSVEF